MPSKMRAEMRLLCCAALLLASASCARVKPWEREQLAHPSLNPSLGCRASADDFVGHTTDVREGASCGLGRAGGGCGCN